MSCFIWPMGSFWFKKQYPPWGVIDKNISKISPHPACTLSCGKV